MAPVLMLRASSRWPATKGHSETWKLFPSETAETGAGDISKPPCHNYEQEQNDAEGEETAGVGRATFPDTMAPGGRQELWGQAPLPPGTWEMACATQLNPGSMTLHFFLQFTPSQSLPSPDPTSSTQVLVKTQALGQLLCVWGWSAFSTS